jgi:hypothetical protein
MTSTVLPRPMVADGVVTIDQRERALVVRPAASARPYAKALWAEGVRAQAAAGRLGGPRTVYASGGGVSQVAYGLPVGGDALSFRFDRGNPVYRRLVGTPGLKARIAVDRSSNQILSVRFTGR